MNHELRLTTTWNREKTEILLTKDGTQLILKKGDFIAYEGHEKGCRIEELVVVKDQLALHICRGEVTDGEHRNIVFVEM